MYRWLLMVALSLAPGCDDGQDIPDDLTSACRHLAECGATDPAESEGACGDRLTAEYDAASSYGCATQHADWVACLATTRGQCSPVDACQGQQDAFRGCQQAAGGEP